MTQRKPAGAPIPSEPSAHVDLIFHPVGHVGAYISRVMYFRDFVYRPKRALKAAQIYTLEICDRIVCVLGFEQLKCRPDVPNSILPRLRSLRLSAVSNFWLALNPGVKRVLENKYCIAFRHVLLAPSDGVVMASFEADACQPTTGKSGGLEHKLVPRGINLVRYPCDYDKNAETKKKIRWYCLGVPTFPTPKDQHDAQIELPAGDLLDFMNDGPQPVTQPILNKVLYRKRPSEITLRLHDGKGRPVVLSEAEREDHGYALGYLYNECRETDGHGTVKIHVPRKYVPGAREDLDLFLAKKSRNGQSKSSLKKRAHEAEVFLRHGCSKVIADAVFTKIMSRHVAFDEALLMVKEKFSSGSNDLMFSEAESKFIMNIAGTKNAYRELASVLRRKYGLSPRLRRQNHHLRQRAALSGHARDHIH
jgi:hypothetical protein